MLQALKEGTPNRNRIALQMVKDVLDESSFDASPGHVVPDEDRAGCCSRRQRRGRQFGRRASRHARTLLRASVRTQIG